jgi:hypothetical protein
MNVPEPIVFPEYTSPQLNTILLAAKYNEMVSFLKEKFPDKIEEEVVEPVVENAFAKPKQNFICLHERTRKVRGKRKKRCLDCGKILPL